MDCSDPPRLPKPPRRGARELPPGTDLFAYLLALKPEVREEMLRTLGIEEGDAFDREWTQWAHEGQQPPAKAPDGSDWSTCVVMGGRGFGKTRTGAEWVVSLLKGPCGRSPRNPLHIALVAATLAEARSVMVEGRSGLMEVAGPWIREWCPTRGTLKFRTGAIATLFSGHTPELLRGPEHNYAWCDELAKWEKAQESWDMLQLGLRVGDLPQALVTTTPRPGPVLRTIMDAPGCVRIGGPTRANPHLPDAYLANVHARYAGTRLARQELEGELLTDSPGALWTEELLEKCRISGESGTFTRGVRQEPSPLMGEGRVGVDSPETLGGSHSPPHPHPLPIEGRGAFSPAQSTTFTRLVIAIDPPTGDGTCGIVACAKDGHGRAHILADHSVTARTPEGWARAATDAARVHSLSPLPSVGSSERPALSGGQGGSLDGRLAEGERGEGPSQQRIPVSIVAESNQGGQMVKSVLRTADPELRVKLVHARHGKAERASPVAILFEAGKVVLHGRFPELEAQLCGMIAGGGYEGPGASPDRADAMVWGLTELMLTPERPEPRVSRL